MTCYFKVQISGNRISIRPKFRLRVEDSRPFCSCVPGFCVWTDMDYAVGHVLFLQSELQKLLGMKKLNGWVSKTWKDNNCGT
jgi:hypothetical protein